jgi:hypothetical protein
LLVVVRITASWAVMPCNMADKQQVHMYLAHPRRIKSDAKDIVRSPQNYRRILTTENNDEAKARSPESWDVCWQLWPGLPSLSAQKPYERPQSSW